MDRSVGSPSTRSVVGVRGAGVSVFGLPFDVSVICVDGHLRCRVTITFTMTMGSQAGVVDINHAFHLYYKCCMWIEFQSIST